MKLNSLKIIFLNPITIGLLFGAILACIFFVCNIVYSNRINYDVDLLIYDSKFKKVKSEFKVAIADTDKKRKEGLMFVKNMSEFNGMLFVFDEPQILYFWMKNTYISLDLLFVDENMNIVSIFEKSTPLSEKSISSIKPAKYVIELNAGVVSDYQIKSGDFVKVVYSNENTPN